ncbi:hypothetical protein [Hyphobacterium sp.]|uniref:hypothetical protein n=1 Tax=Hyphobacterium sp. TaxID=2004662 RepID=UPI0037495C3B
MNRKFSTLAFVAAGWLALAAWDTRVITNNAWQAIYQEAPSTTLPEHTHVSDTTFDYLDSSGQLRGLFGRGGSATLDVVDLNASFFRVDELLGVAPVGDDPATDVEERRIPPPGLFAGLPDYSYGLYDWLNKNTTCPAFSDGNYAWRCHEFLGWLGAMNSVHFGSQATDMYAHHHRNALALARRAREMRASMTDVEREAYEDELREAELLALAYEGYAQHFLQDRWAMGHMWERWGAPDPQQEPDNLPDYIAIGGLSGLIHGAEALINDYPVLEVLLTRADSMSSPVAGPGNTAIPMNYRHVRDGEDGPVTPGIGDERFQDALNGRFSLNRYEPDRRDQNLNVQTQMDGLMECAGAGWSEVIRELGPGENGGYGIYGANLDESAPDFAIIDQDDCWNMWATNESMMIGLLGPNAGQSLAMIAATDFAVSDLGPDVGINTDGVVVGPRSEFVALAGRLWLYGRDDPNGTQVARGEMTSFAQSLGSLFGQEEQLNPNTIWGFQEGGAYSLPDYAEPIGLITEGNGGQVAVLAEIDARGRDIQTLYGAFTGAQSDYWCEHRDVLEELRMEPTARNRELCERLAGRMYQGIHPDYGGPNTESREYEGQPVRSMCQIRNAGVESDNSDDVNNPYWLDQGYLPMEPDRQSYEGTFTDIDAVVNWCARVPVITLSSTPELRDENVAAVLFTDEDELVLEGYDFGVEPGQVTAIPVGPGRNRVLTNVISWRPTQVRLDVSNYDWEAGDEFALTLTPAETDARWTRGPSVGEFYLQVREPPEIRTVTLDLGGVGPCMDAVQTFDIVNPGASFTAGITPEDFQTLTEQFSDDIDEVNAYFNEQLACMRQLRSERIGALNDARILASTAVVARQGPFYSISPVALFPAIERLAPEAPLDQSDIALWQDYYTTYIELLDGTMRFLEGQSYVMSAWARAWDPDQPMQRNSVALHDLVRTSVSAEDAFARGFVPSSFQMPDNLPREMRASLLQASAINLQFELETLSDASQELIAETLRGLRTWTQTQHAITQRALPQLQVENSRIHAEANQNLQAALSVYAPDCSQPSGDGCVVVPPETPDIDAYAELSNWIADMMDGHIVVAQPVLGLLGSTFLTADGHERMLRTWPTEDAYQAALTGPGSGETRLVGPADSSPK